MEHERRASVGSLTDFLHWWVDAWLDEWVTTLIDWKSDKYQKVQELLSAPQPPAISIDLEEDFSDLEKLNIVRCGDVDNNGRICVCVYACRIPGYTDYDRMLRYAVTKLDRYCENDYSLVYFHYGYSDLQVKPSWSWLVDCYRSFDRKFKKNIKGFYVVHPNIKLKMVFKVLKPLVSAQSSKKIFYCNSLHDLSEYFVLNRLDVPLDVINHDKKLSGPSIDNLATNITALNNSISGTYLVFGESLGGSDEVPLVVQHCISYLRTSVNLTEEGLFRRSGNVSELRTIKEMYNTGQHVDFTTYCPHTVASVLKTYLRDLKSPILTFESYPTLSHWGDFSEEIQKSLCKKILDNIPTVNYLTLRMLILFLNEVTNNSTVNKMSSQNIAIVIGPNLVWNKNSHITSFQDIQNINRFCRYLVDNPQFFEKKTNEPLSHQNGGTELSDHNHG